MSETRHKPKLIGWRYARQAMGAGNGSAISFRLLSEEDDLLETFAAKEDESAKDFTARVAESYLKLAGAPLPAGCRLEYDGAV